MASTYNDVELTRENLHDVLSYMSTLLPSYFPEPVRLLVHGGACMLLHPGLYTVNQSTATPPLHPGLPQSKRKSTRDVDYINRAFKAEWAARGINDASARLNKCIMKTAERFRLGEDWMNCDADVALPLAYDEKGVLYDPVAKSSLTPTNVALQTVYMSPNGKLTLIGISTPWALAFKFARYKKYDPEDIVAILVSVARLQKYHWTPEKLESLLFMDCSPMQWERYDPAALRGKITHAVQLLHATKNTGVIGDAWWPGALPSSSSSSSVASSASSRRSLASELEAAKKNMQRKSVSSFRSLQPVPSAKVVTIERPASTMPMPQPSSIKRSKSGKEDAENRGGDYVTYLESWRTQFLARGDGVYSPRPPPQPTKSGKSTMRSNAVHMPQVSSSLFVPTPASNISVHMPIPKAPGSQRAASDSNRPMLPLPPIVFPPPECLNMPAPHHWTNAAPVAV